jgi:hypothetical protein
VTEIEAPPEHIIMINSQGHAIDPTGNLFCQTGSQLCKGWHVPIWLADYDELGQDGREDYDEYLDGLFASLRKHSDAKNNGKRKVLIFVHGGMNKQKDAIERAAQLSPRIKNDSDHYYPIFINWDSSFLSSYYDHLFHVRQGVYYRSWQLRAWVLAPFYFLADMGRMIAQTPMLWLNELAKIELGEWLREHVSARLASFIGSTIEEDYKRVAEELATAYAANPNGQVMAFAHGIDKQKFWPEMFWSSTTWFLTLPFKILSAPIIDAFGESSWRVNLHRTRVLFHTETESAAEAGGQFRNPAGALAVFMNRLVREYHADQALIPPREWEITLVGHSMGTIVLNETIRRFGVVNVKDKNGNSIEAVLPFHQIAYMAAACTVRDYEDSVFPYLKKNKRAQFYHLTLHEEAEERERVPFPSQCFDLLPRGSILVWLDDFMADPMTYLDRTLGGYATLMLAAHNTPDTIRRQISIKAFDAGETVQAPQVHTDFVNKFIFWKPECWKPIDQDLPACFNNNGHY